MPALPPGTTVRVGELDGAGRAAQRGAGPTAARAEVLRAGLIAFPLVVAAAGRGVLAGRRAGAPAAAAGHRDRPAAVRRVARRAHRVCSDARGEVAELAAGVRRDAGPAAGGVRGAAPVRRQRQPRAAHPAVGDAHRGRRDAGRPGRPTSTSCVGWPPCVRDATRRADELVAGLLLLARSQAAVAADGGRAGAGRPGHPGRRRPWMRCAAEAAACLLRVDVDAGPATTRGDRALLERVVGNLVENGVRHNVAGRVAGDAAPAPTTAGRAGGALQRGGGRRRAGARAVRAVPPRAPGAHRGTVAPGWGCRSCVRWSLAHGGQVHGEPVDGGGLAVTVQLPVDGAR